MGLACLSFAPVGAGAHRGRHRLHLPLRQAHGCHAGDPELAGRHGAGHLPGDRRALAIAQFGGFWAHPGDRQDKWRSLLATNRYWLLVSQGAAPREQEQWDEAATLYRRAIAGMGVNQPGWGSGQRTGPSSRRRRGVRLPQGARHGSAGERRTGPACSISTRAGSGVPWPCWSINTQPCRAGGSRPSCCRREADPARSGRQGGRRCAFASRRCG